MVTAIMQFSFHDEFLEIYDKYTTDIKKTQSVNNYEVVLATIIKGNVFRPPPPPPSYAYDFSTSQARVFIPPRTTAKTLVAAGHVGLQEFIA